MAVNPVPGPLTDGTAAFPYAPAVGPSGDLQYDNIVYSCEPGYRPLFLDLLVSDDALRLHHKMNSENLDIRRV